ncbi:hypothetical protein ANANG_G00091520 [Anguilla anguilla]|uniref:Uncharacterized protein n=1 Tax=Anguilla anguilla TaxID=7936 RepID=A0A9D3MQ55_ANGAN|nr:hypothetical protein ANANG_G00091520 [Anguilla anguilla]
MKRPCHRLSVFKSWGPQDVHRGNGHQLRTGVGTHGVSRLERHVRARPWSDFSRLPWLIQFLSGGACALAGAGM